MTVVCRTLCERQSEPRKWGVILTVSDRMSSKPARAPELAGFHGDHAMLVRVRGTVASGGPGYEGPCKALHDVDRSARRFAPANFAAAPRKSFLRVSSRRERTNFVRSRRPAPLRRSRRFRRRVADPPPAPL